MMKIRAAASEIGGALSWLLKYIIYVMVVHNPYKSASEKMIKQRAVFAQTARLVRGANLEASAKAAPHLPVLLH